LALIGSLALGVVWGWWSAPLTERGPRLVPTLTIITAVTLQSLLSLWFNDVVAIVAVVGGWLLGWLVHGLFRISLRTRGSQRTST
jgi:hypothetical protein